MKKISLLSLAAIAGMTFASSAHAVANTANPLYMPTSGNFFITAEHNYNNHEVQGARSDDLEAGQWNDTFTIGYGFSKKFAMTLSNETPRHMQTNIADAWASNGNLATPVATGIFRAVQNGNVVLDLLGSLNIPFQDNEAVTLGAGIRAGIMAKDMTLAVGGNIGYGFAYDRVAPATGASGAEVDDNMAYTMTVDLQMMFNKDMSLNLGGEYMMVDEQDVAGIALGEVEAYRVELGLNMNIKDKMLFTPYLAWSDIDQDGVTGYNADGFEYGLRFGVEF